VLTTALFGFTKKVTEFANCNYAIVERWLNTPGKKIIPILSGTCYVLFFEEIFNDLLACRVLIAPAL
jgi:hypothetical protein